MLVSSNNTLSKKRAIMKSVKDIHCHSISVGLGMFISMVLETSGIGTIQHECVETRDEGHIRECSPCFARLVQMQSFAPWAFIKAGVQTSKAYT